jgi:hypothetical protein
VNNPALPFAKTAGALCGAANEGKKGREKYFPLQAAKPIEKAQFGRENPRKSKTIQHSRAGVLAAKRPGAKKTQTDRSDHVAVSRTMCSGLSRCGWPLAKTMHLSMSQAFKSSYVLNRGRGAKRAHEQADLVLHLAFLPS